MKATLLCSTRHVGEYGQDVHTDILCADKKAHVEVRTSTDLSNDFAGSVWRDARVTPCNCSLQPLEQDLGAVLDQIITRFLQTGEAMPPKPAWRPSWNRSLGDEWYPLGSVLIDHRPGPDEQ